MRKNRGKIVSILLIFLSIVLIGTSTYAHSGRTDANGGHRDNKNKSGLGSYHYHCGGHPAHLHPNGVCPYSSNSSSSSSASKGGTSSSSSSNKKSTSSSSSSNKSNASKSSSSSNSKTTTKASTVEVTGIKINQDISELEVGESKNLTATITPGNATNKDVTWKSSDKSIAEVTSEGKIIAKKAGTVEVTATCSNGKTSTIKIRVKDVPETENNVLSNYTNNNIINNVEDVIDSSEGDLNPLGVVVALGLLGGGGYLGYKIYKKEK